MFEQQNMCSIQIIFTVFDERLKKYLYTFVFDKGKRKWTSIIIEEL